MKESLKIAVFHCGFAYSGGGERLVLEEVMGLRRLGHDVSCYAPTLDRKACFPDFIDEVGVSTFLPQLPRWFPLRDAIAMALSSVLAPLLALRFRDIDVFVGANQPGAWIAYCMAKVLGRPYVIYLNQPNRLIYPRKIDQQTGWLTKRDYHVLDVIIKRMKRFVGWADRTSTQAAEVALANGGYIARIIEQIYEREIVLCPAGCHPQSSRLLRLNPHTAYEGAFKLGDTIIDKPVVLITNRHEPQKKFEYVIEAISQIGGDVPAASLVIPGPFTPHTPKLIALAEELGIEERVLFLGQISEADLQRLYREAAVYCYPAPEEDFGMGVIEAMAWGIPIVAWNNAGPTVTVLDGETGFLVEPRNVGAYSDAMSWLLQDHQLRSHMGARGRERVERYFTWGRHFRLLDRAVRNAVGEQVEVRIPVEIPIGDAMGAGPLKMPSGMASPELAELETGELSRG
ncbi:MAG: glycosyltransferase family 4 protein [Chloroflexi bacterium]|nr:glycosyltransferase family 4 protein [Chloroflexota bacterium]